jgi:hypothetical protein
LKVARLAGRADGSNHAVSFALDDDDLPIVISRIIFWPYVPPVLFGPIPTGGLFILLPELNLVPVLGCQRVGSEPQKADALLLIETKDFVRMWLQQQG